MEQKGQPPVLWIALIIAAFLVGTLWTKVQYLEKGGTVAKGGTSGGTVAGTGVPQATNSPQQNASPLSLDSLKAYAQELKLDTNKFNSCLSSKGKASLVKKDIDYGGSIGVNGTPAFFINGKFLSGAQPLENFKEIIDKEINGTGSEDASSYSQNLQNLAKAQGFDPKKKDVAISATDPAQGSASAKVTIVEFSDFQCPFCERAFGTVEQVLQTYKGSVRLVYKQYPLPFHEFAEGAAEASLCAADQGKFWEYHNKLFTVQKQA